MFGHRAEEAVEHGIALRVLLLLFFLGLSLACLSECLRLSLLICILFLFYEGIKLCDALYKSCKLVLSSPSKAFGGAFQLCLAHQHLLLALLFSVLQFELLPAQFDRLHDHHEHVDADARD